jgi:chemotaxis protein CheC
MPTAYSVEQTDALQEVVNVGMGQAANALAITLETFVLLPVPSVRLVGSSDVLGAIRELTGAASRLTAVRQAFTSSFRGEALVIFGEDSARDLAPYLGYEGALTKTDSEEILLDVSNLLVGACVGGIAQQLSYDLSFSAPSFIGHDASIEELLAPQRMTWERSLLVEVNFRLEREPFVCHILLFWPETSMEELKRGIDRLLEGL